MNDYTTSQDKQVDPGTPESDLYIKLCHVLQEHSHNCEPDVVLAILSQLTGIATLYVDQRIYDVTGTVQANIQRGVDSANEELPRDVTKLDLAMLVPEGEA